MRVMKYTPILASSLLALAAAAPAVAQTQTLPQVEMETTSVMLGVGGQSGDGLLRLPNLGTNCAYPFKVDGFGAGIQVGVSKVSAAGAVQNMSDLAELAGDYSSTQGQATLVAGAGGISMKNRNNNVQMSLASQTQGVALGFGAQGMTVKMSVPPVHAPKVYILEFGFNKDWIGQDSRAKLAQAIDAWKCRFVNVQLVGHTDTVGREDKNLELAAKRAKAVQDFLVGAGLNPSRITVRSAGADEPLVTLPRGQQRARINRAVVLYIM